MGLAFWLCKKCAKTIKFFFTIIFGCTTIFTVLFESILSLGGSNTQKFFEHYGKEEIYYKPHPPSGVSIFRSMLKPISGIVGIVWKVIRKIGVTLTIILAAAPYTIVFTILIIYFGLWFQNQDVYILSTIQTVYDKYIIAANIFAIPFNIAFTFISFLAPVWNDIITYTIKLGVLLFHAICPGNLSAGFATACPIIETWINYFTNFFLLIIHYINIFFQALYTIFLKIGSIIICPSGYCSGSLCQFSGQSPCQFDFGVFVAWLFDIIKVVFEFVIGFVELSFYFAIDLVTGFIYIFGPFWGIGNVQSGSPYLSGAPTSLVATGKISTPTADSKTLIAIWQTILIIIEDVLYIVLQAVVDFVLTLAIVLDTLFCWVFVDFNNCVTQTALSAVWYPARLMDNILPWGFSECSCGRMIYRDKGVMTIYGTQLGGQQAPLVFLLIYFMRFSSRFCVSLNSGGIGRNCTYMKDLSGNLILVPYTTSACVTGIIVNNCYCVGNVRRMVELNLPSQYYAYPTYIPGTGFDGTCKQNIDKKNTYPPGKYAKTFPLFTTIFNTQTYGDGIPVPCVPGQAPCNPTYSLLARIFG